MKPKFGSQLLTLPQIFDGNLFNVPDYQRGYAWTETEVKALLEDIDHLLLTEGQGSHFTGTLVVNNVADDMRFDIVDGQQRLTSIVILMRCLRAVLTNTGLSELIAERYLKRGPLGNEILVLQLGTDSREFFERVVLGDDSTNQLQPTLAAHQNMEQARKTIETWLKTKDATFAEGLIPVLESRLGLLVYNPNESAEVGIMFEVINNRGKNLSQLEKVKNYLIYTATKLGANSTREKVNSRWSSILKNLHLAHHTSDKQEDSFLRSASILQFSLNKNDSGDVYYMLRTKFLRIENVLADKTSREAAITQIESFVELLEKASHWYAVLYGNLHEGLDKKIAAAIERIYAQQQHANIMPILLAVLIRHGGNHKSDGTLVRLLELIEKINFRVHIAPGITYRTDSGQGMLYGVAAKYHNQNAVFEFEPGHTDSKGNTEIQLEYKLVRFALEYATDSNLENSIVLDDDDNQFDFYQWSGLKYFLICYEASLNESKTVKYGQILSPRSSMKTGDYYSVEHIWATKHEQDIYDGIIDSHCKRRLGNFMLLELNLNIIGSAGDLKSKVTLYSGKSKNNVNSERIPAQPSEMAQVRELIKDAKGALSNIDSAAFADKRRRPYREIHRDISEKREKRFKTFIVKQWSLKEYRGYHEALKALRNKDDD